jgi:hypothetical protein
LTLASLDERLIYFAQQLGSKLLLTFNSGYL